MNKTLSAQGGPARGGKIASVIIVLVAIGVAGWFLVGKKSQDNVGLMQKNVEVENGGQQEKDETVAQNEEQEVEEELWNAIRKNEKYKQYNRRYFKIDDINGDKTVALGNYNDKFGGANIFAFRHGVNDKWNVRITQEGLLCSDIVNFSKEQIQFLKKNYTDYCVEFDTTGEMHKKML